VAEVEIRRRRIESRFDDEPSARREALPQLCVNQNLVGPARKLVVSFGYRGHSSSSSHRKGEKNSMRNLHKSA
jgi:hypothetical protein